MLSVATAGLEDSGRPCLRLEGRGITAPCHTPKPDHSSKRSRKARQRLEERHARDPLPYHPIIMLARRGRRQTPWNFASVYRERATT